MNSIQGSRPPDFSSEPSASAAQPLIFQSNPGLADRMETYRNKYCPGVTPSMMHRFILEGEKLEKDLAKWPAGEESIKHFADMYPDAARNFLWLLMAKAGQQGQEFTRGAFRLDDPDQKIFHLLMHMPGAYTRISTHMKEKMIKGEPKLKKRELQKELVQWGLDLRNEGLPANKHTILFASLNDKTIYIKPEDSGCPPFWKKFTSGQFKECLKEALEWGKHAKDFIASRLFTGSSKDGLQTRKERVSPQLKKQFEDTVALLFPPKKMSFFQKLGKIFKKSSAQEIEVKKASKEGISAMHAFLKARKVPLTSLSNEDIIKTTNFLMKLDERIGTAPAGYEGEIKGEEVILPGLPKVPKGKDYTETERTEVKTDDEWTVY